MGADERVNVTHKKTGHLGGLLESGSRVYGWGAVALGLIGLAWGDFATVWQPVQALPFTVPYRGALAYVVAGCLLAGGLAVQRRRTARAGAVVLAVVYFIFSLFWVPRVIGYPRMYGTWLGLSEQLSLVTAAVIIYASSVPRDSAWAFRTAQIGRLMFVICVLSFGLAHFFALPETAGMVPNWIPPGQRFWAVATGVAFLLAGVAMLTGVRAVLAARLLTLMLITFGALVWAPSLFASPRAHVVWAGNAINLAIAGAAWVTADSLASRQKQVKAQRDLGAVVA